MDIQQTLNNKLLNQEFSTTDKDSESILTAHKMTARTYARTENAIAVLSDMKANISYLYYGGVAETLDIAPKNTEQTISSIWEEKIFKQIHPEDLVEKYAQELRFFHFLKKMPVEKRTDYYIANRIRMRNKDGKYFPVIHRMFYIASAPNGSIWLALCLYNLSATGEKADSRMIIDTSNGTGIEPDRLSEQNILTTREKEILSFIGEGKASKDIARLLCISINTVNRHRQNILEKLHADNSIQAYQIAKELGLL